MKSNKYILFILCCLFLSITLVKAENISLGEQLTVIEKNENYKNLTCSITASSDGSPITLSQNSVSYYVSYNRTTSSSGRAVVTCTWEEDGKDNYKEFGFSYSSAATGYYKKKSYTLENGKTTSIDLKADLGMKEAKSISFTNNTDGIISTNCSGTTCTITLNPSYYNLDSAKLEGSVTYTKTFNSSDVEITTELVILINRTNAATAVPTGYGTCGTFDTSTWVQSGNRYKSKTIGDVVMPDCTPKDTYPLLVFAGWTKSTQSGQVGAQTVDTCAESYSPQKGKINLESGAYYFACYKTGGGVVLYPGMYKLADSTWTKSGTRYFKKSDTTIVLPNIVMDGNFSETKEFKGWKKVGSETVVPAGTAVPADGSSYQPLVETTIKYVNYYKTITIGESYLLTVSEKQITSCVSTNTAKVEATGTGECILVGKETTDNFVDVIVYGDDGYQKTFYVSVTSRTGMSEAGDDPFIVNVSPNVVASVTDSSTLNTYFIDTCTEFEFDQGTTEGNQTTDPSGTSLYNYKFSCTAGSSSNFIGYCLDAGRHSPTDEMKYVKSEQIDLNSDFGKLIGYMAKSGLLNGSMENVRDVTVLVRVVGIIDNIAIASDYNAGDEAHAGSYSYYEGIARSITTNGQIDPAKVMANGSLNSIQKQVLANYQKENTSEALMFERTVEDIKYSDIDAAGNYSVTYKGTMLVPGSGATLSGWGAGGFSATVTKFEVSTDPAKQVEGRVVYEYEVTISGNINSSTLPAMSTGRGTEVTEESKNYSFKLNVSGSSGTDAFLIEPSGRAASENYQRMLMVNDSSLTMYTYFSPAPEKSACGKGGLSLTWPTNPTLFRATGCCNLPGCSERVLNDVCSTQCTSSNLDPVCDYRASYTGVGEKYDVIEGYKNGTYKIGGAEACIVETRDHGYGSSLKNNTQVNTKQDDAGNTLMVASFKDNRYCRVSCREEWEFGLDSFGNFTGENAIAAGSYFQLNKSDLFISGKRTCYTTFIRYGNTNTETEIGAGDTGFTKDLSDASDKLVTDYNKYSNLSHVYADLACENDEEYTTSGGHTVKCDYSDINGSGVKFCSKWTSDTYCWNKADVDEGSKCSFEVDAWSKNYCIDADGKDGTDTLNGSTCQFTFNATYHDPWYTCNAGDSGGGSSSTCYYYTNNDTAYEDDDGKWKCDSGTLKSKTVDGEKVYYCRVKHTYTGTYHAGYWYCSASSSWPSGYSNNLGPTGRNAPKTEQQTCTYNYKKIFYGCELTDLDLDKYSEIPDEYREDFERRLTYKYSGYDPEYGKGALLVAFAKDDLMKHAGAEGTYSDETGPDVYDLSDSAVDYKIETNNSQTSHKCNYSYAKRSANLCTEYSICLSYWTKTTNQVDDGDKTPEGAETAPGQYVKYQLDSEDGKLNPETKPVAELPAYDKSGAIKTGDWTSVFTGNYNSFAYQNLDEARLDGADESGLSLGGVPRSIRYARSTSKYFITGNELKVCIPTTSAMPDGLSYSGGPFVETAAGSSAVGGGSNVMLRGVGPDETCWSEKWDNCHIKTGTEEKYIFTIGNYTPPVFSTYCGVGAGTQEKPTDSFGSCDTGSTCDTDRAKNIRETILENSGIKGKLTGYANDMIAQNNKIITYAKDMFACQHFEMYNASDGQNNERKNNSLWTSNFMGTTRPFVRIVSTYEPEVSYSYAEKEYMTLLGDENIMERFEALNASTRSGYGCYDMTNHSGTLDCYNNATNQQRTVTSGGNTFKLSRNYTQNVYFDRKNEPWDDGTGASYGGGGGQVMACSGNDCNIGSQVAGISFYKRTELCSIGLTNDDPITVSTGDMKASGLTSVYVNDKDFFWTAGTCFINQVQYVKANYVSASIENSSFFKNKGYWYVNDGTDVKAHGDNLILALKNSNDLVNSKYDTNSTEITGQWSVLGDYNVFPIKMTTPRDLYEYVYTFSNIGSYGDGKAGRIMGNDQSLIAVNSRTCFYEVFEEICLCCGNPITTHTDDFDELVALMGSYYVFSKEEEPQSPTLTITSSTVSLSDIDSDKNRTLGANWSDASTFFYNGETFTTSKGAELLKEIQAEGKGENIYKEEPEYEFIINPTGMQEIRQWNDQHGYQINFNANNTEGTIVEPESRYAMVAYDRTTYVGCTSINTSQCTWDVPATTDEDDFPQNRIINFTHFKSKFLSEEISKKSGITYQGLYSDNSIGMSETCYVDKTTVNQIDTLKQTCRWVDYLETATNRYGETGIFRLAFK